MTSRAPTSPAPEGVATGDRELADRERRAGASPLSRDPAAPLGRQLFWAWEIYQHTGDRADLKRRLRVLRRELKPILARHAGKDALPPRPATS